MTRLVYGACLYGGWVAREAAGWFDNVAVVLENLAGELAPFDYRSET